MSGLLGLLKRTDFRRLFLARTASVLGDGLVPVAVTFAAPQLGGGASTVAIVLAARSIPLLLFTFVGGVWASPGDSAATVTAESPVPTFGEVEKVLAIGPRSVVDTVGSLSDYRACQ